ncbi:hypothetical protein [Montanilutibacter psychrotolerans]|uniref:Glycosyltransferase RgtA/B/C/D-like domain-containing protein n=1 Tax=Montanilutibacter psychrotolerans TaxID=1327343 RepID=A0A3M8SMD9_9GAMM|nr:hypothetical protein [Lysobacter psychrotolerans]RNF81825.1 hypothetical protein EER27_16235 [Lysobacter psychrotolerans]
MHPAPDTRPASQASLLFAREAALIAVIVLAIKLAWLVADHTLRVYMGDSMVYLQTAAWLSAAPGRSFLYGAVLHFSAMPLHTPIAIVIVQVLWSTLSTLGVFAFLRRALGLGFWLAAIPALALASDPAQVFFERMVMAETIGLLALVATVLAYSRYLFNGSLWWFLGACLCGLGAANFRTNLLPVVIGLGITVPLLRLLLQAPLADWRFRAQHLAAAMAMLLGSHLAYTHAYGYLNKCPPGYLALSGMMQVGLVAPLIRAEDFEGTGVSGDVLKQVQLPLDDHWQRGHHIWDERGLWRTIEKNSAEPEAVARVVTRRAMLRDFTGLLRINVETLGGYFDREKVYWRMQDDKGVIAPDEHALQRIQEWLRWDARGVDAIDTPARRYFAASTAWLTSCLFLLFPLAVATAAAGWRTSKRAQYCLLALVSMGLVASHVLFAHIVSFRYLHPLPWFVLANVAAIAGAFLPQRVSREARTGEGTPTP